MHLMWLFFSLLVAASDSTSAVIESFVLAMTSFPEVQRKAQEELDRVLCGRLPTHADIPSLPYLTAVIKEVIRYVHQCPFSIFILNGYVCLLRWRPIVPLGE